MTNTQTIATLRNDSTCTVIARTGNDWTYATAAIAGKLNAPRSIDRRELDRFVADAARRGFRLTYA